MIRHGSKYGKLLVAASLGTYLLGVLQLPWLESLHFFSHLGGYISGHCHQHSYHAHGNGHSHATLELLDKIPSATTEDQLPVQGQPGSDIKKIHQLLPASTNLLAMSEKHCLTFHFHQSIVSSPARLVPVPPPQF